jgi:hypothetical protein
LIWCEAFCTPYSLVGLSHPTVLFSSSAFRFWLSETGNCDLWLWTDLCSAFCSVGRPTVWDDLAPTPDEAYKCRVADCCNCLHYSICCVSQSVCSICLYNML